jgi:Leucine-rich repeat (LRR) protein
MHRASVERLPYSASLPPSYVPSPRPSSLLNATRELYLSKRGLLSLRGLVERSPNLETLWVNSNALSNLEGLETATRLLSLFAHNNHLEDIGDCLCACSCLTDLTLHNCRLNDLTKVLGSLSQLEHLRCLSLYGNPISNEADYRLRVIACLPALIVLDDIKVSSDERKTADARFVFSVNQRRRTSALAFGTRGRTGTNLPAIKDSSSAPPVATTLPVFKRVERAASAVLQRKLAQQLAETFEIIDNDASFVDSAGNLLSALSTTAINSSKVDSGAPGDVSKAENLPIASNSHLKLSSTDARRLVMQRTGVRLEEPTAAAAIAAMLALPSPAYQNHADGDSPHNIGGRLGEWDKLRLLKLLKSSAGRQNCVTGQQLLGAVRAMADFGCVAVSPVCNNGNSDETVRAEEFLLSQMRRMDPFGSNLFGIREYVDSLDTGVYQVQ